MKTNSKRKVFGDAVDLLMGDMEEVTMPRGVQMVPVKSIHPFHDHPFHLYEGERLEDMIASVKEHGVLNPVIVQKLDTGYEMLSGHNRWNAAKLAGIKEIPAIVKTDLSEEEAYVYVIETNLMQRSFSDLAISEKAAVLKARYEKEACQGKRNDILEEIARLEGKEISITRGHDDHRLKTRDMIGKEYELSGSSVGRLLKLNDLIKPFKDMVDRGALYTKVALQLAFLPENEQTMVYEIIKEKKTKITIEMVMKLRSHSGALTEAMVKRYLSTEPIKKKCYKVPARIVEKYFEGMDPNKVDSIVEHIINCINFMFAGDPPFTKSSTGYDTVTMTMESDDGYAISMTRKIIDGKNGEVGENSVEVISNYPNVESGPYSISKNEYSDLLLKLMGINEHHKIISTEGFDSQSLGIRTLIHFFFIDEEHIFGKRTVLDSPSYSKINAYLCALNFLLTGDDSMHLMPEETKEERERRITERTGVIAYLNQKIEELSQRKAELEAREAVGETDAEGRIEELLSAIEEIENEIGTASSENRELVRERYEISTKIEEALFLKDRYRVLKSQYEADILRLHTC